MDYDFRAGDETHRVLIEQKGGRYTLTVDGVALECDIVATATGEFSLLGADGATQVVVVRDGPRRYVALEGHIVTLEEPAAAGFGAKAEDDVVAGVQTIKAPMPGKVVKVVAAAGATVAKGQTVVIVEAMKMEHALAAAGPGVVQKVICQEGQNVDASQPLAEVLIGAG